MSEPEDFLARWSRRKREAAESPQPAPPDGEAPAAAPPPDAPAALPSVDLAALPPIESITAATDIRGYLAPGVPAELTRAALRRAWVADPAIRDFVGIAENQWNFNDPHGVPGFGPLHDSARLLARLLGDDGATEPGPAPAAEPCENEPLAAESTPRLDNGATEGDAQAAVDQPAPQESTRSNMSVGETAVAPQHDDPDPPPAPSAARRGHGRGHGPGHGGALPR